MTAPSSQPAASPAHPTPERLFQYGWGFALTHVLATAVELEVFRHVAEGKRTVAAIAKASGATERGVRMIVDALVGLGLVSRAGTGPEAVLSLAPDADAFLVKGKPSYLGEFLVFHAKGIEEGWHGLTDTVRTGKPFQKVDVPAEGVPLWHHLVDSLFALGFPAAQGVGKELARLYPGKPVRLLDVAAGSGVWGLGAATTNPAVRPTLMDLPETLEHARRFVDRMGLASRVDWLPGDLRTVDFGTAKFEAATLGHILHSEGAEHSRRLLAKTAKALVPGGTLVIAEFLPDPDRNGPALPLLFALNMLVHTSEGDTFTVPQLTAWLEEAGFKDVRTVPAPSPSPLVFATRR
jgi:ubiquinone/menaquinone biosynthesis C-methylase UbiE